MTLISFSSATYQYNEEIEGATISIKQSGNRGTSAVVLVASNNVLFTGIPRIIFISCNYYYDFLLQLVMDICLHYYWSFNQKTLRNRSQSYSVVISPGLSSICLLERVST